MCEVAIQKSLQKSPQRDAVMSPIGGNWRKSGQTMQQKPLDVSGRSQQNDLIWCVLISELGDMDFLPPMLVQVP